MHIAVDLYQDGEIVGPQFLNPNPLKSVVQKAKPKIIT